MFWIVILVFVAALGVGVIGTLRLVQWSPKRAELANDDDSEIPDRAIVTITGTVRIVGEPLISPLSARRCVMYETYANLYEWAKEGEEDKRVLAAQLARTAMVPFELVTAIGVVLVDATEADLELAPTPVFPRRPEREALFLREHERDERLIENASFEETTVDPDSLVSVSGMARVEGPTKIRLTPDGERPLVIGTPRKSPVERA